MVIPDDGVSWQDSPDGVVAWLVAPRSPGDSAGIKSGDVLKSVDGLEVRRATQVTRRLFRVGAWTQVRYQLSRGGETFDAQLVTVPQDKPASIENYLRIVGLLYLFIGMFIFARRWNAPRAVHFYIFCLVSFILYSFHYTGKPDSIFGLPNEEGDLLVPPVAGGLSPIRAFVAAKALLVILIPLVLILILALLGGVVIAALMQGILVMIPFV